MPTSLMNLALVVCAAVLAAPLPCANGEDAPSPAPVILEITTLTRVIDVYAVVSERGGSLVPRLAPESFDLREDGARQKIEFFAHETDAPLSVGLLIDVSPSQLRVLGEERRAATAFLSGVLGPTDQACVVPFGKDVAVATGFTDDQQQLQAAIDGLRVDAGGAANGGRARGTRLYDAIAEVSQLMRGRPGRRVLVLLTDGEDQGSTFSRSQALALAEQAGVILYAVFAADPLFYWGRGADFDGEAALGPLLARTGGSLVVGSGKESVAAGLARIAAQLRAQYRLGYVPRDPRFDGSYRRISVRVADRRLKVQARGGYYATAE